MMITVSDFDFHFESRGQQIKEVLFLKDNPYFS